MNKQELAVNIAVLEHLGWFIAEDETDEDANIFDVLLLCCRPDGTTLERVPITPIFLSFYDEEDGSLEARLWYFAPKYSTSMDTMQRLVEEPLTAYEWTVARYMYMEAWFFQSEINALGWSDDGEDCTVVAHGCSHTQDSASMALAIAYLDCLGVKYESDHSGN